MSERVPGEKPGPLTHYTIDGKRHVTTLDVLTPREVLTAAGLDPATHALARVEGGRKRLFRNPDEPIPVAEHMEFVSMGENLRA
jgi:hypothetical protein